VISVTVTALFALLLTVAVPQSAQAAQTGTVKVAQDSSHCVQAYADIYQAAPGSLFLTRHRAGPPRSKGTAPLWWR